MFKWRVISRSNVNGKVHTFQKDFDDYDTYQEFVAKNPEYNIADSFQSFWNPWKMLDRYVLTMNGMESQVDMKYLPEGMDLAKYESRRQEKRQKAQEQAEKKYALESSKTYLEDYLKENEDDSDAKADLAKVEAELKMLA